ncbi:MAG: 30S ribosome-binding factor RbfA [Propionibacteriaceae bacterium]|jgi:ribosome-binding factor A|nr:30S ribosome-binding factor RbfA [Propionibacteriaceae bacterium]
MASPYRDMKAERIKEIVAAMLERRVKDPRLGFVTITDVRLSADGREASVFYTVLGDASDLKGTEAALRSASGMLRTTVGQKLGLKFTPTLKFIPDALEDDASYLEEILAAARQKDADVAAQAATAQYAGEADPYKRPEEPAPEPGDE